MSHPLSWLHIVVNFIFDYCYIFGYFFSVMSYTEHGVSVRLVILNQMHMKAKQRPYYMLKRLSPANDGLRGIQNFVAYVIGVFSCIVQITWLLCLLLEAGDIHPNPGTFTSSSTSSISDSLNSSFSVILNSFHHLSFVPYNVQSIYNKLDVLSIELSESDILAFTESWLHPGILDANYHKPERKDRNNDLDKHKRSFTTHVGFQALSAFGLR